MEGGEVHKARMGSVDSGVKEADNRIHLFSGKIKHYSRQSPDDMILKFDSVLNVSAGSRNKQIQQTKVPTRALIIIHDGMWGVNDVDVQVDVIESYFHRLVATKIQKGTQQPMLEPLVYHSGNLHHNFDSICSDVRNGNINPILYFDMSSNEGTEFSLKSLKISKCRNINLHNLIPEDKEHRCNILHIGIFSKKFQSNSLKRTLRRSNSLMEETYEKSEISVNFIFPSETYSEETKFAYEIGAIARFIETIYESENTCTEALSESQNTIKHRHNRSKRNYADPRTWAIANSSLIYVPNATMNYCSWGEQLAQTTDIEPFSPRIETLRQLTLDFAADFPREACQKVEKYLNILLAQCLNLINEVSKEPNHNNPSLEWFSMAMGIEFARFHWESGGEVDDLAEQISDETISLIFQSYQSNGCVPFPRDLFVYKDPTYRVANGKIWTLMKRVHAENHYDNHAAFFSDYVYKTLIRNGLAEPISSEERFPHTKSLITRVKNIQIRNELNKVFTSGRDAFGVFLLDQNFAKDFGKSHWNFHKTHADAILDTGDSVLNNHMAIWYEDNADYRMKPADVNKSLGRISKRLDEYCSLDDAGDFMWDLEGGDLPAQISADWLTKFRSHLEVVFE